MLVNLFLPPDGCSQGHIVWVQSSGKMSLRSALWDRDTQVVNRSPLISWIRLGNLGPKKTPGRARVQLVECTAIYTFQIYDLLSRTQPPFLRNKITFLLGVAIFWGLYCQNLAFDVILAMFTCRMNLEIEINRKKHNVYTPEVQHVFLKMDTCGRETSLMEPRH